MSEGEKELPLGWSNALFSEVIDLHDNERKPINRKERDFRLENSEKRFPYYGATGQVGFIDDYLSETESILLGEDGAPFLDPYKKKAYVVNGRYWVNNHAHVLRAKGNQPNDFYCHQLNQFNYYGYVSGTTRLKLTQSSMRKMVFLVPPLAEQSRIVDKIDELFSSIEAGERAIARARTALTRYRKAVLKAAVTGELTADWRAKNLPSETAEALLERILKARYAAWEKTELEKLDAKGKARPKTEKEWVKFRARYKDPVEPDLEGLPDLPEGWVWTNLSSVSRSSSYGTSTKCSYDFDGVAVMRIPNVRGMSLNLDDLKFAQVRENLASKGLLETGDLLIIRTNGSSQIVGLGAVVLDTPRVPCYFASYLIRFRLCLPYELCRWINSYWQTEYVRRFVREFAATSAGQYNVSMTNLETFPVPLPPLEEQAEIVSRVEEALSKADKVEATLDAQARSARALKQAVLKTAFEGRLVPQNPNDEPASELLKRIKAAS